MLRGGLGKAGSDTRYPNLTRLVSGLLLVATGR